MDCTFCCPATVLLTHTPQTSNRLPGQARHRLGHAQRHGHRADVRARAYRRVHARLLQVSKRPRARLEVGKLSSSLTHAAQSAFRDYSDHQSFWEEGYPSTWVFERNGPIRDPEYHSVSISRALTCRMDSTQPAHDLSPSFCPSSQEICPTARATATSSFKHRPKSSSPRCLSTPTSTYDADTSLTQDNGKPRNRYIVDAEIPSWCVNLLEEEQKSRKRELRCRVICWRRKGDHRAASC